jgi:hypothetical protein
MILRQHFQTVGAYRLTAMTCLNATIGPVLSAAINQRVGESSFVLKPPRLSLIVGVAGE